MRVNSTQQVEEGIDVRTLAKDVAEMTDEELTLEIERLRGIRSAGGGSRRKRQVEKVSTLRSLKPQAGPIEEEGEGE